MKNPSDVPQPPPADRRTAAEDALVGVLQWRRFIGQETHQMQHVFGAISIAVCVVVALLLYRTSKIEWEQTGHEGPPSSRVRRFLVVARALCLPACALAWYGAVSYLEVFKITNGTIGAPIALLCVYATWLSGWRSGWNHERRKRTNQAA